MEPEREAQALADFRAEALHATWRRPRRLPPGNRSVRTILALERELNEGSQLSTIETDWQVNRRIRGA